MRDLKLTLVGGCLNSGYSAVTMDGLYHRLLVREVEEEHEVRLRARLGRQFQMNARRIVKETREMLARRPCDGLVFQIRPEWFYSIHIPIWVSRERNEGKSIWWNPYLWGGQFPWENSRFERGSRRSPELMMRLSRFAGLTARATKAVEQMIEAIAQSCAAVGTDLILLGPVLGSKFPRVFVDYANSVALPRLAAHSNHYIDVTRVRWMRDHFAEDEFHLNAKGHREIANVTKAVIGPWAVDRLRSQSQ